MSYNLYNTEGIIIGGQDIGEADRVFSILTKEFGRLDILSQEVRLLKSKLRYHLKLFSYGRFSFVGTKNFWRLTDAEELLTFDDIYKNPAKLFVAAGIANLLNRMLRGQERDIMLWQEVKQALLFLEKEKFVPAELKRLKLLAGLRILHHLGYIGDTASRLKLSLGQWDKQTLEKIKDSEEKISQEINKAIKASHL